MGKASFELKTVGLDREALHPRACCLDWLGSHSTRPEETLNLSHGLTEGGIYGGLCGFLFLVIDCIALSIEEY